MSDERLPALGQPDGRQVNGRRPGAEPEPDRDADFADEHDITAVDRDVAAGRDADAEEESPKGWSGLDG
jgi:hypothetical protein